MTEIITISREFGRGPGAIEKAAASVTDAKGGAISHE